MSSHSGGPNLGPPPGDGSPDRDLSSTTAQSTFFHAITYNNFLCPHSSSTHIMAAGMPIPTAELMPEEIMHVKVDHVDLYVGEDKLAYDGTAYVTTHRVIWKASSSGTVSRTWLLSSVSEVEHIAGVWGFTRPKAKIMCSSHGHFKLSCQSGGSDDLVRWIDVALTRRSWEASSPAAGTAAQGGPTAAHAGAHSDTVAPSAGTGIAGLLAASAARQAAEARTTSAALADLQSLMASAKEVVQLAHRYAQETPNEQSSSASQFDDIAREMGILNPVTKAHAGAQFHAELAREIAQLAPSILARAGGFLTLPDVYCAVNRARGTALVSPEDVKQACQLLRAPAHGCWLRVYPSTGVHVLADAAHSDDAMSAALLRDWDRMAQPGQHGWAWVEPARLASIMSIPLAVAEHVLAYSETQGLLARDESFAGVRWYRNDFGAPTA